MKRIIAFTLLLSVAAIAAERKAKNVVLFIGDAAGLSVLTIAGIHAGKPQGLFIHRQRLGHRPAACYAHSNDRSTAAGIFAQFLKPRFGDGVDVLIGAGRQKLMTAEMESGMRAKNYGVYDSAEAIPKDGKRAVVLFDSGDFDLAASVRRAVDVLSQNKKGFFLMVESDLHTDDLERGILRTIAFDQIIEETAQRLSKDTLIIFTADHSFDTRLRGGRKGDPLPLAIPTPPKAPIQVADGHTGEEVVAAAQGPGAARVRGFFRNTDLFRIMMAAYGW